VAWFGIVLTILGVCGVYLDFIGSELESITDHYMSQKQFMLIAAVPLLFLSLLRSLKYSFVPPTPPPSPVC
jgi:amino acid permease